MHLNRSLFSCILWTNCCELPVSYFCRSGLEVFHLCIPRTYHGTWSNSICRAINSLKQLTISQISVPVLEVRWRCLTSYVYIVWKTIVSWYSFPSPFFLPSLNFYRRFFRCWYQYLAAWLEHVILLSQSAAATLLAMVIGSGVTTWLMPAQLQWISGENLQVGILDHRSSFLLHAVLGRY